MMNEQIYFFETDNLTITVNTSQGDFLLFCESSGRLYFQKHEVMTKFCTDCIHKNKVMGEQPCCGCLDYDERPYYESSKQLMKEK